MLKIYFGRFKQNKLALTGLGIILALGILALAAHLVAPYAPDAQHLSQRLSSPSEDFMLPCMSDT